ncbi:MAG TPA: hypothetical protein VFK97_00865, partial [Candidatus Saccharimonadales bacterium]|nr:hypothetical protein [Candidatus Saccharimonadales bacterium]
KILAKLTKPQRQTLAGELAKISRLNQQIEQAVAALSPVVRSSGAVDRQIYSLLPDKIAAELLAYWLRHERLGEIDSYEISRLKLALKTAKADTNHPIKGANRLVVKAQTASFAITS